MKRWIDGGALKASRTAGGHRRVARSEAVRFGRRRDLPVLNPAALGLGPVKSDGPLTSDALAALLLSDRAEDAPAVVVAAYLSGMPLGELFDGPVREALVEVGEIWHDDDRARGIYIEHRAVPLIARAIAEIRTLIPPPAADAPVAVGGGAPADPYFLPSTMAAAVLADAGWRAIDLGADTPVEALVIAARQHRADLVWFSLSAGGREQEVPALLAAVSESVSAVVVGGRGVTPQAEPGAHLLPSMQALAEFAADLRPSGAS